MLPVSIQERIENLLGRKINRVRGMSGGSINRVYQLETNDRNYVLKLNSKSIFPKMFEAESRGLGILRDAHCIRVPDVIACIEQDEYSVLLLEHLQAGLRRKDFWKNFGKELAGLHRHTSGQFGLDHDNYMGSLPQSNNLKNSWIDFFMDCRLVPQWELAVSKGYFKAETSSGKSIEDYRDHFEKIIPEESPSLLHGDLWSGNFITGPDGNAALIDPAVYYGHREMDLAMTRLFGGFDEEFYEAYNQNFPLEKGYEKRTEIFQLYPLLVHVNLFGGGYEASVRNILRGIFNQ